MDAVFSSVRCHSIVFCVVCFSSLTIAQTPLPQSGSKATRDITSEPEEKRLLELEVLIQTQPTYRVKAQEWGRAFQEIGYAPRFRQPKPGEKMRIEDVEKSGKKTVLVVGGMSSDGTIRIADRKFTVADLQPLRAMLDELGRFGAGGPPEMNPKWGLTDDQLLEVSQVLSEPVTGPVTLQSPVVTVDELGLPANMRMKFKDSAREKALARRPESAAELLDLTGFSKGTAMAIVLAQYGLGFRPLRLAPGQYDIEIDTGDESSNLWPVGWKSQESVSAVLPAYLKSIDINVEDVPVNDVIGVVAERLMIPVQNSSFVLAARGKDLNVLTYTRKATRMPPGGLLTSIGDKHELGFDVRVDEAGKLFLWVTTSEDSKAFRTRFAHIKQK